MKYIALLRGINVGKSVKVNMKELKDYFQSLGFINVSTYINSGNVIFESNEDKDIIVKRIEDILISKTNQKISVLVKSKMEIVNIVDCIPVNWLNDVEQKTDIAFLFKEIDNPKIIDFLPLKMEYIQVKYINGAVIWNVTRENYNKSQLNKIVSNKIYKSMTVRNVNTARYLASIE